jgi:bacillithiol synthase
MKLNIQHIPYNQTGFFNALVLDYLSGATALHSFYSHQPNIEGIKAAIEERKNFTTNRLLLTTELQQQYSRLETHTAVAENIQALSQPNTFTVTTAHQPNIFTGHLYFVYKIIHAVVLAQELHKAMPENNFVPVYYMGSEDADLDELGQATIEGKKYVWATKQTGAVGRMKTDSALLQLIDEISGQIGVYPYGQEIIAVLKNCYTANTTIEQATFKLVNHLFGKYGVVVLLPDNAALKKSFTIIIEKELQEGFSYKAVNETAAEFPSAYKMQASGRAINLFYLKDNSRERIEQTATGWQLADTKTVFTTAALLSELHNHPERFSPNVILRPVFQELILPNIAFIGGGGEIAYWLELKRVFATAAVPFPALVLRNSFLYVAAKHKTLAAKLKVNTADLFKTESNLFTQLVERESNLQLKLEDEAMRMQQAYASLQEAAGAVDKSLLRHVDALQTKALKKIEALEKKLLRAEKKKFEVQQQQLHKLKTALFPNNSLQERIDNILPYYAQYGSSFIAQLFTHSKGLLQQFTVIEEAE